MAQWTQHYYNTITGRKYRNGRYRGQDIKGAVKGVDIVLQLVTISAGGGGLIVLGPFTPDVIKATIIAYTNYCIRQGRDN